jgi:hypothetical protein
VAVEVAGVLLDPVSAVESLFSGCDEVVAVAITGSAMVVGSYGSVLLMDEMIGRLRRSIANMIV